MQIAGSIKRCTDNMMRFSLPDKYRIIAYLFGCAIFFIFTSCEEDLTTKNKNSSKNFPSQVINNARIIQRDSGFVTMKATAPIIEMYHLIDSPYTLAKKGMNIEYFDKKKPGKPGTISAKFAKIYDYKQFYEARGNVKILTADGQRFATQTVFWDQKNRKIFTKDTVYATMEDGSILVHANGMTAKDDFSEYTFYNNSGDLDISKTKIAEGKK